MKLGRLFISMSLEPKKESGKKATSAASAKPVMRTVTMEQMKAEIRASTLR